MTGGSWSPHTLAYLLKTKPPEAAAETRPLALVDRAASSMLVKKKRCVLKSRLNHLGRVRDLPLSPSQVPAGFFISGIKGPPLVYQIPSFVLAASPRLNNERVYRKSFHFAIVVYE